MKSGGVTGGGYAIPHSRNFSALFSQIRRQKLGISAILWGYEQHLPTSYKQNMNHFLFILHVTDQIEALLLLLILWLLSSDLCDMHCFRLF